MKTMKRYMMTLVMAMTAWMGANAMDYETAREQAYYLTDKMAYELNLNEQQYNDAYEINLDYLLSINTEADLLDSRYLTYRNEDLREILHAWQWTAFVASSYLFRPLLWRSGAWYFPVYDYYARTHFYYHRPSIFWEYRGGHGRFYYSHGFYASRRPVWNGGLRGHHHTMIGRPHDHHSISHRGGPGYHIEHRGHGLDNGRHHNDFGRNHNDNGRSHNDFGRHHNDNSFNHSDFGRGHNDNGGNHSVLSHNNDHGRSHGSLSDNHGSIDRGSSLNNGSRNNFNGSSRGSFSGGNRGGSFSGGSSRGSFSGSSRGGFSGGSRGGSLSGGSSRGSFSGSSRGGSFSGGSSRGGFGGSSRGGRH